MNKNQNTKSGARKSSAQLALTTPAAPAAARQQDQQPVSWIDHDKRAKARLWTADQVLDALRDLPGEALEKALVVGKWIWVQFENPPAAQVRAGLSQLGFHWSPRRQAWQHPCGVFDVDTGGDPIRKYGAQSAGV